MTNDKDKGENFKLLEYRVQQLEEKRKQADTRLWGMLALVIAAFWNRFAELIGLTGGGGP